MISKALFRQPTCSDCIMRVRGLLGLALSIAAGAMAQPPGFLLGVDYSEWLPLNVTRIAADSYGALYILSAGDSTNSSVTKLHRCCGCRTRRSTRWRRGR